MPSDASSEFPPDDRRALPLDVHCTDDTEPARIVICGDVNVANAARVQSAVIDVLRQRRPSRIDVDLTDVAALDTDAIGALIVCQADALQVGCQLHLANPRPVVHRALRSGLLEAFGLNRRQGPAAPQPRTPGPARGLARQPGRTPAVADPTGGPTRSQPCSTSG